MSSTYAFHAQTSLDDVAFLEFFLTCMRDVVPVSREGIVASADLDDWWCFACEEESPEVGQRQIPCNMAVRIRIPNGLDDDETDALTLCAFAAANGLLLRTGGNLVFRFNFLPLVIREGGRVTVRQSRSKKWR